MLLMQLPPEIISSIVFVTLLSEDTGDAREDRRRKDERERIFVKNLCLACACLRRAASLQSIIRRCLSSPSLLESLLLPQRRETLFRFLRLSGGYRRAVAAIFSEIELMRAPASITPLRTVATCCKLCGQLLAQISAYAEAEELLLSALDIDKSQEGAPSTKVEKASTLLTLSEMLRGCVSACQVARDRRQFALRGIKYSVESFAISQAALRTADAHAEANTDALNARRAACAKGLHLLGYHCAEFASGTHATGYFEQATIALSHSQEIFKELKDDEMTATTLQDLGLCYYYQHRYKEAMALYTSAMRVIIDKLGPCHVALACPAFNIANIMCAAGTYDRAIDFYRIAWSINVQALGQGHAWTETALSSLQEAIECHRTAALYSDDEIAEGAREEMSADDDDSVVGGGLQAEPVPSPRAPGHAQSGLGATGLGGACPAGDGMQATDGVSGTHVQATQRSDREGGAGVGGAAAAAGRLLRREDAFCWSEAEADHAWAGVAATKEAHSSAASWPAHQPCEDSAGVASGAAVASQDAAAHGSAALPTGVQGGTAGSQHLVSGQQGPWQHSSPHRPDPLLLDDGAIELMVQNGLRDVDVDLEQEHGELFSDSEDGSDDDWREADHQLSLIQLQLKDCHELQALSGELQAVSGTA